MVAGGQNLLNFLNPAPKQKPVVNLDKDRSLSGKKRVKARRRERRDSKSKD